MALYTAILIAVLFTGTTKGVQATSREDYKEVLGLSWLFYEAQRSGVLPPNNRIPWRGNAHVGDLIPGGWYDAGDHLKLNFALGTTVSFLAWGMLEFQAAYSEAGQTAVGLSNLRWASKYLMRCHISRRQYVGQIGIPNIDHSYWGRPEDQTGLRPALIWNASTPASDLLGAVSAGLASTSLIFKQQGKAAYAAKLLKHAKQLYAWARQNQGQFHTSFPSDEVVYSSSRYLDKLMYAAAWLYRATGNAVYLNHAKEYWDAGEAYPNIYVNYDSVYAPAVNLLLAYSAAGVTVPGADSYATWFQEQFLNSWINAKGDWGITRTPKGLVIIGEGGWGSLRNSLNAGLQMLLHAQYAAADVRAACIAWAQSQADYALGSGGRSYVVGWGNNPPTRAHHRGSSCPDRPASCDWDAIDNPGPNPQVLYGALVGGPTAGDEFIDDRRDYVRNEVAAEYNSGFTGVLAGLIQLL